MMIFLTPSGDSFIMADMVEFQTKAKNILKAEFKRRGVSYKKLAESLEEIGVHETDRNIANKISRGSFSAAFFLQCLAVIGCRSISLEE